MPINQSKTNLPSFQARILQEKLTDLAEDVSILEDVNRFPVDPVNVLTPFVPLLLIRQCGSPNEVNKPVEEPADAPPDASHRASLI
jgi:hypothetical protein